jgi:hypothetical protein
MTGVFLHFAHWGLEFLPAMAPLAGVVFTHVPVYVFEHPLTQTFQL